MANRSSTNRFTAEVRETALRFGAHLAGVTGVERLDEAPRGFRPTDLMPGARSVVVLGIGLPQGLSDCWEQSVWSYLYYGYAIPNKKLGHAAFNLATWLQHHGHGSFPVVPTLFMKDCEVMDPMGEFTEEVDIADTTWDGLRPKYCSLSGSSRTWNWREGAPSSCTLATPGINWRLGTRVFCT